MKINSTIVNKLEKNNTIFNSTIFMIILKYYLFIIFHTNLKISMPRELSLIVNFVYLICLSLIFLNLKSDIKDKILIFIGGLITLISKNGNILIFFMLAIYARNNKLSIKHIVKIYTIISLIMFLTILISYTLGIIGNGVYTHYRNGIPRIDFGFGNPNVPFLCLMPILTGYIYLKFDKYSIIDRIIILVVLLFLYFNTYSRTGLIAILITLTFIEVVRVININYIKNNKYIAFALGNIFTIMCLFSIFVAIFLNKWKFNVLLSSRPEYWNFYLREINFIGFNKTTELIYPLDNSYIYLLKMFGILSGLLIVFMIAYTSIKTIKEGNVRLYSIIAMFSIYSFGENIFFDKALCPLLIILTMYFIDDFGDLLNKIKGMARRKIDEK